MLKKALIGSSALSAVLMVSAEQALAYKMTVPGVSSGSFTNMTLAGISAATLGALLLSDKFRNMFAPKLPGPNMEDEIPFIRIDGDNKTVICDKKKKFVVLQLAGFHYASSSADDKLDAKKDRQALQGLLSDCGIDPCFIERRRKMSVEIRQGGGNEWLREINSKWADSFDDAFVNLTYIVLYDDGKSTNDLGQGVRNTLDMLDNHKPKILEHHPGADMSPLWSFLNWLVNGEEADLKAGEGMDLAKALSWSSLPVVDKIKGLIVQSDGLNVRFHKYVGVEDIGTVADRDIGMKIMRLPYEISVFHYIQPLGKFKSTELVKQKKTQSTAFGVNRYQAIDFDDMENLIGNDQELIASYECVYQVTGSTQKEAEEGAAAIRQILGKYEYRAKIETSYVLDQFFRRWPSKAEPLRSWDITHENVADLLRLEATPHGLDRCWWGPHPIRTLRTAIGAPYSLGFHEGDHDEALANGLVFGKARSGKTVAMVFMITGALSYFKDFLAITFDNLDGMTTPCEAFGGVNIKPGHKAANGKEYIFAPLMVEDTPQNRVHLTKWLIDLTGLDINASDFRDNQKIIEQALDLNFAVPLKDRTLQKFYANCVRASTFKDNLEAWATEGGAFYGWFTGETDPLDLDAASWINFDMQEVLEHPRIAKGMIDLVTHRIRTQLWIKPRPHLVFMDEGGRLVEAPGFAALARDFSRQIGKKMGAFWMAFQEPGSMKEHAETFITNSANYMLFRNPALRKGQLQEQLNLSDGDEQMVLNQDDSLRHIRRFMLYVRKASDGEVESVPLDVNLKPLGKHFHLLRSGIDCVEQMTIAKQEYGPKWQAPYCERMALLEEA